MAATNQPTTPMTRTGGSDRNERLDQARALLREIIDRHGWTPTELARRAGLRQPTLTRFLGNEEKQRPPERGLGLSAALKIERALAQGGVSAEMRRAFVQAIDPMVRVSGAAQEARTLPPDRAAASSLREGLSLDVLAEMGIALAQSDQAAHGYALLRYLVNPAPEGVLLVRLRSRRDQSLQLAAAVASGHLGHAQLNIGQHAIAENALRQALRLLDESGLTYQHGRVTAWERWQVLTGRSPKDFELWCDQMLGVVQRMVGTRVLRDEARSRLRYVAEEARRGQLDPRGMRANALRDLAAAKVAVNPAAPQAEPDFAEAVGLLADLGDVTMLAITLAKRAQWHKARGQFSAMERDALTSLTLGGDPHGVVRVNLLNTLAGVYADLEPVLAKRLAKEALETAQTRGYAGQRERSETVLTTLKDTP